MVNFLNRSFAVDSLEDFKIDWPHGKLGVANSDLIVKDLDAGLGRIDRSRQIGPQSRAIVPACAAHLGLAAAFLESSFFLFSVLGSSFLTGGTGLTGEQVGPRELGVGVGPGPGKFSDQFGIFNVPQKDFSSKCSPGNPFAIRANR